METAQALELKVNGMHCDACVRRVTKALGAVPGVEVKHVEVGSASVTYDPSKASPSAIEQAVDGIGFEVVR
jgi:copper chaperone